MTFAEYAVLPTSPRGTYHTGSPGDQGGRQPGHESHTPRQRSKTVEGRPSTVTSGSQQNRTRRKLLHASSSDTGVTCNQPVRGCRHQYRPRLPKRTGEKPPAGNCASSPQSITSPLRPITPDAPPHPITPDSAAASSQQPSCPQAAPSPTPLLDLRHEQVSSNSSPRPDRGCSRSCRKTAATSSSRDASRR